MNKYWNQIIAISGDLGSGKTTIAMLLGKSLNIQVISTGAFHRELAKRKGMTTLELNRLAENDKSIDAEIDAISAELERSKVPVIVDSRMAWYFIPSALKIYLTVDDGIAAERIFAAKRDTEQKYKTVADALHSNQMRRQSEIVRFQKKYGVEIMKSSNFDLIFNTNTATPELVVDAIYDHLHSIPNSLQRQNQIELNSRQT